MTGPVVTVTRDSRDRVIVDWYEDEDGYYVGDPIATARLSAFDIKANCPPETVDEVFHLYHAGLAGGFAEEAQRIATHTVAEPGAPLEPIPGRAA